MTIDVRAARREDDAAIARIALASGQPTHDSGADARYVEHLRTHGTLLVALADDAVVGFGAAVGIGDVVHLTDLFVAPDARSAGVGRALVTHLWDGETNRTTFSSQHASALPLYARFGLRAWWPLLYLSGEPRRLPRVPAEARRVDPGEAAAVELELTGTDRSRDYRYWSHGSSGDAFTVAWRGRTVAAGALAGAEIAHLAVRSPDAALDAVVAAARVLEDAGVVSFALPGPHPALPLLLARGFAVTDFDICMSSQPSLVPATGVVSPGLM